MPWNRPIFCPNCTRSAACRTARSSARSARPRQVAATCSRVLPSQVPARSNPLPSSPSSASPGTRHRRSRGSRWCSRGARRCGSRRAPPRPGCRGRPGTSTSPCGRRRPRPGRWRRTGSRSRTRRAWLMKCLVPLIRQPSPSRTARVRIAAQVGAGVRLGHRQAVVPLAADAGVEVALSFCASVPASRMFEGRPIGRVQRVVGPAELLLEQHPGDRVEPGAADLLGHVRGVQPGRDRLLLDLRRASSGRSTPVRSTSSSCG